MKYFSGFFFSTCFICVIVFSCSHSYTNHGSTVKEYGAVTSSCDVEYFTKRYVKCLADSLRTKNRSGQTLVFDFSKPDFRSNLFLYKLFPEKVKSDSLSNGGAVMLTFLEKDSAEAKKMSYELRSSSNVLLLKGNVNVKGVYKDGVHYQQRVVGAGGSQINNINISNTYYDCFEVPSDSVFKSPLFLYLFDGRKNAKKVQKYRILPNNKKFKIYV